MADSFTSNLNLNKVEVGASRDTWGGKINDNMDKIDAGVGVMQRQIAAVGANAGGPAPQGRLSFQSGVPVMFNDVNSSVTCYYCPYQGNSLPVYDTVNKVFVASQFSELSQDLTDTKFSPAAAIPNALYDLFVWRDKITAAEVTAAAAQGIALVAGDPILRFGRGYPWNSATTRGTGAGTTELVRVGPYLVNRYAVPNGPAAGAGTYLGTIYVSPSNRLDWSLGGGAAGGAQARLHCFNYYNRIDFVARNSDTSGSHQSPNNATIRQYNGSVNNSLSIVCGYQEDGWQLFCRTHVQNGGQSSVTLPNFGFGFNQYAAFDIQNYDNDGTSKFNWSRAVSTLMQPMLGRNVIYLLESMSPTGVTWVDSAKDQELSGRFVM